VTRRLLISIYYYFSQEAEQNTGDNFQFNLFGKDDDNVAAAEAGPSGLQRRGQLLDLNLDEHDLVNIVFKCMKAWLILDLIK